MITVINPIPATPTTISNDKNPPESVQAKVKKEGLLDKFETNIRNSADMNDTVKVPRTIFKGYLSIMTGSTMIALAMLAQKSFKKISNALNLLSAGFMIFGTYSFVRPYLLKNKEEKKP